MEHRFTELSKLDEMARLLTGEEADINRTFAAATMIGLDEKRAREVASVCDKYNGYSLKRVDKRSITHKEPIYDITKDDSPLINPDDPSWKEVSELNDLILISVAYNTEILNRKEYNASILKGDTKIEHEIEAHIEDKEAADAATKYAVKNLTLSDGSQVTGNDIIAYFFLQSIPFIRKQFNSISSKEIFGGKKGLIDIFGGGSYYAKDNGNEDFSKEAWNGFVNGMWILFRYGNKEFKRIYPDFGSNNSLYQTTPIEDAIVKLHTRPEGRTLTDIVTYRIFNQITNLFGSENVFYKTDINGNELVDEHGNKIIDGSAGTSRGLARQIQNSIGGKGLKGDINKRTRGERTLSDDEGNETSEFDRIASKSTTNKEEFLDYQTTVEKNLKELLGLIKNSNAFWSDYGIEKIKPESFPEFKLGDNPTSVITKEQYLIDDAPLAKLIYTLLRYPGCGQEEAMIRCSASTVKFVPVSQKVRARTKTFFRFMNKFAEETKLSFPVFNYKTDSTENIDALTFIARYLLSIEDTSDTGNNNFFEDTRNLVANSIAKMFESKFGHPLKIFEGQIRGKLPSPVPMYWDVIVNDNGVQLGSSKNIRGQGIGEKIRAAHFATKNTPTNNIVDDGLSIQNESKENIFKGIFFGSILD